MKVKLISLAVLILLSAISSIFNAMPMIGTSAQDYETVDDRSYGNNNNNNNYGMVDKYSYEPPNTYNTDKNGYSSNNNYDPSLGQQNSEYSSYGGNSYGPPTPNYGDGNAEYSSYSSNNYEYSSNTGYTDESYSLGDPGSYGNQYNNYYAQDSYDSNYYPPKKPQKFTCPDSGLVVDKPESCPIICPFGSTLSGHFVAAGSNLTKICNVDQQVLETCPAGTDLEGVFVTDATPEQCNIFATCDSTTPLGEALGLNATQTVEVADAQLCNLEVPSPVQIFQCPSITEDPLVNPLLAEANVTDIDLCFAATPAVQCPDTSPLDGVWVDPEEAEETCNIVIPPPVRFEVCPTVAQNPLVNPLLAGANVTDIDLCFAATPAVQCGINTTLNGTWVHPDFTEICDIEIPPPVRFEVCPTVAQNPLVNPLLAGANVTDIDLCFAATPAVQCGINTTLNGTWVHPDFTAICNIDITTGAESQCLKCADLATSRGNSQAAQAAAADDLIGNATNNVFTICDNITTAETEFNETIRTVPGGQDVIIEAAFGECLDNAQAVNDVEAALFQAQSSALQAQAWSLQENSLTTNVKPETEIPTFSEKISPPTIAQETGGDLSALAKIAKLKQQWLDLLP